MIRPASAFLLALALLAARPAPPPGPALREAPTAPLRRLSDRALLRYAAAPFDKRRLMFKRVVLGRHRGLLVVADHPCGDVCPAATRRIVHYDIAPERCARHGGIVVDELVPAGIAVTRRPYCEPRVPARRGKAARLTAP